MSSGSEALEEKLSCDASAPPVNGTHFSVAAVGGRMLALANKRRISGRGTPCLNL